MEHDALKLTTYFGERDRDDGRFVADALLDLYGRHGLRTSVLLRGAAGFGHHHHLRTDRLLTLSEDLPLVSVAVDTRERIDAVLPEVAALHERGLVTLERARLLHDDAASDLPEEAKLTLYFGRGARADGAPAYEAVCALLHRRGIAGATVLLGVDGTVHGARERAGFARRNARVPLMLVAVGEGARIAAVLPELGALLGHPPLATLERIRVCKRDGALLARPDELPGTDEHGLPLWQKLMVYTSEQARHDGRPLHAALVEHLRRAGAAGATTVRGIWGFHGDHAPHGDRLLQLRRRVPLVTTVVDAPERIATWFDVLDGLTTQTGLVTSEMVPAQRRGGEPPPRAPASS